MTTTPGYVSITHTSPCGCVHALYIDAETWVMGWQGQANDLSRCAAHEAEYEAWLDECHHQEMLAELEAERRNELFWENRGVDDGFDEWERSRGVLSYEEARDMAMGV